MAIMSGFQPEDTGSIPVTRLFKKRAPDYGLSRFLEIGVADGKYIPVSGAVPYEQFKATIDPFL